jgi:hypothetical protein
VVSRSVCCEPSYGTGPCAHHRDVGGHGVTPPSRCVACCFVFPRFLFVSPLPWCHYAKVCCWLLCAPLCCAVCVLASAFHFPPGLCHGFCIALMFASFLLFCERFCRSYSVLRLIFLVWQITVIVCDFLFADSPNKTTGLVRSIGVSNFNVALLTDLLAHCHTKVCLNSGVTVFQFSVFIESRVSPLRNICKWNCTRTWCNKSW